MFGNMTLQATPKDLRFTATITQTNAFLIIFILLYYYDSLAITFRAGNVQCIFAAPIIAQSH